MTVLHRNIAPKINPIVSFALPAPQQGMLSNGMRYFLFYNKNIDLLHFIIRVKAGSVYERQKYESLMCYSLLKESDAAHSAEEVDDFLDYYGAFYQVTVLLEYVEILVVVPKTNCLKVLSFIKSFLVNPCFKEKNLALLKQRKIMNLEISNKKLNYRATQHLFHALFGEENRIGVMLTKEAVEAITTAQLLSYHRYTFSAPNIRFFAAGNIDTELYHQLLLLFDDLPCHDKLETPFLPVPALPDDIIMEKHDEGVQSSIILCKRLFDNNHEDCVKFSVLSTILGGYFGSRLMNNLREKNGYTYGIHNGQFFIGNTSVYYIESEVNINKTKEAVAACRYEIERLQKKEVGKMELEKVKSYMQGALLRDIDNTVSYMKQYCTWSDFGHDEHEFETKMNIIKNMDSDTIKNLANRYLPIDSLVTIVVGNLN